MILLDNKAIKAICNINNKDSFLYNLYIEGKKEGCDAEYTKFSINQIHEYNNTLSKYDIISPYNTKFNLSQRRHMSTCGHFLSNALTSINRCSCKHEHIIFGTNSDIKNFYKHNFDKNAVDFSGDIATSMRQIITSINSKFPNLIKDCKYLEKLAKNINEIEDCNLQNILRNKKIRNQLFKTNLEEDEMEMTKSLLRYILLLGCAGNIIAVPEYAKCSTNQS